ncbi:LacI family DNA-binding transcriptional regulator [Tsuneonella dongtanensis]|uniref:LacI family DNA-binding transcriptional regulator n=1 Tax=Tsuneonella dongtanensis TaxID=692370 RepID=UPI001E5D3D07|nr:LacI family DNA-binding transcriptional regulator [Tsuneonella dongtanensis]
MTSFDVAEAAGVSQSTVSRALAGSPSITEETRARVEAAAATLGYHVDARAARLRSGRTGTLAVVVVGRAGFDPTRVSGFHYALLGSTCAAAAECGYQSLVSFQSEQGSFSWNYVAQGQADGLVVMGTSVNRAAWNDLLETAPEGPVAVWGAPFDDDRWVRASNFEGAVMAVERLVSAGYRRIGFLGTVDSEHPQFAERYEGYRDTLVRHGLPVSDPLEVLGDDRVAGGRDAIARLLAAKQPPDAVFAANDAIALGALEALDREGVRVPEDFGVIGFDGLAAGVHSHPPLTTIEPDFAEAGRALVSRICDPDEEPTRRVPVRLIERGSVRAPR